MCTNNANGKTPSNKKILRKERKQQNANAEENIAMLGSRRNTARHSSTYHQLAALVDLELALLAKLGHDAVAITGELALQRVCGVVETCVQHTAIASACMLATRALCDIGERQPVSREISSIIHVVSRMK